MWFLRFVAFIWIFYAQIDGSDTFSCPAGHMVQLSRGSKTCVRCPKAYFQPEITTSQMCKPCTKCFSEYGSEIWRKCTLEQNSLCKCRDNFVPQESDASTCKCATGFTLRNNECVEEEKKIQTRATTPIQRHLTAVITSRPQEGTTTQELAHNITTATTTTISTTTGHRGFPTTTERTRHSPTSSIVVGFVFVTVALLVLTALICKQNILPRMKSRSEQSRDASFRMPVEESGDGSQDSLKQNQEEP